MVDTEEELHISAKLQYLMQADIRTKIDRPLCRFPWQSRLFAATLRRLSATYFRIFLANTTHRIYDARAR